MGTMRIPFPEDTDMTGRPDPVDILILGAGWTYQFLPPVLEQHDISHAATTTSGRDGTISFRFDPDSDDDEAYKTLPQARTVVITFPLKGTGQSEKLVSKYNAVVAGASKADWIQLGSTGIFTMSGWSNSRSDYDRSNPRAIAEDELLTLNTDSHGGVRTCVLNLAGLYDGITRDPRNWVARVAKDKDGLKAKGAVHFIHGGDVARAILAAHLLEDKLKGRRWIVADMHTYDWWELAIRWSGREGDYGRWVRELMTEEGVGVLPRGTDRLGRVLDSREFWNAVGLCPVYAIPGGNYEAPRV